MLSNPPIPQIAAAVVVAECGPSHRADPKRGQPGKVSSLHRFSPK